MKIWRCAIYTRKSSEEGLEQNFNSLHAQRDACSAYVLSQAGEGWIEIPTIYDDGGFSGGSMERPALKALMTDIAAGRVDIVVVYKVDRLTRSLADFARIVELFDQKGVSFVSVTQAFNTTNSMGRLTLNVLLSFAQFEREVTGERIRDKIAASKRKGLWMGGRPPLGYDGVDRKLVVNPDEAGTVRHIFKRYLVHSSAYDLAEELRTTGVRSKCWVGKSGATFGGKVLLPGALYHLLTNPTYRGAIRHKDKVYPDAHPAIIDEETWNKVQVSLSGNAPGRSGAPKTPSAALLQGMLFGPHGEPMGPVFTSRGSKRYRYYTVKTARGLSASSLRSISMGVLDEFVLTNAPRFIRTDFCPNLAPEVRIRNAVLRVCLGDQDVQLLIADEAAATIVNVTTDVAVRSDAGLTVTLPIELKHRQGAKVIEAPGEPGVAGRVDRALVRAVALARSWSTRLESGDAPSLKTLAVSEGYCDHYAARLLPLAWLAPDLVEQILQGRQPPALSLGALTREPLPVSWEHQRQLFQNLGRAR